MPEDESFPIDPDLIKVLASDTRRDILRLLRKRRMTLTELSTALKLRKATILEHLNKLGAAGLITRHDDDERIWVYYELSRHGARVVNPGHTRFYLVVGSAVAAVSLAAGIFLVLSNGMGLFGGPTADEGVRVSVQAFDAYEGSPPIIRAAVTGVEGDSTTMQAYLLTPAAAELLRVEGGEPVGFLLASKPDDDVPGAGAARGAGLIAVTFEGRGTLPPGTYFLYVRDATGKDNVDAMPPIRVHDVESSASHGIWWKGLEEALAALVRVDGAPVSGSLRLVPESSSGTGTAQTAVAALGDGTASFDANVLDAFPEGIATLEFLVDGSATWVPMAPRITIATPGFALVPANVETGRATDVHITTGPGGPVLTTDVPITVDGEVVETRAVAHGISIRTMATEPGTLEVGIGRLERRPLVVHLGLDIAVGTSGDDATAFVHDPSGTPIAGAEVRVDEAHVATTNSTGVARFPMPAEGLHALRVVTPAGEATERVVAASRGSLVDVPVDVNVTANTLPVQGGRGEIRVSLRNDGPIAAPVTVVALVGGIPVTSQGVTVPASDSSSVTLVWPSVPEGAHEVAVRAVPLRHPEEVARTVQAGLARWQSSAAGVGNVDELQDEYKGALQDSDDLARRLEQLEREPAGVPFPGASALVAAILVTAVTARWTERARRRG